MTEIYRFTHKELEDFADSVKTAVMLALVAEGHLETHTADQWCALHGVVLTKKTIFRTITNFWDTQKESQGFYAKVVHFSDDHGLYSHDDILARASDMITERKADED